MPSAFAREMVAHLDERDRDYLHECSINDEVIDSRPYLTLTDQLREELVQEWGFHPTQLDADGIVIYRYDVATGEPTYPQVRYRLPRPNADGELMKYCSPKGSGGVIDVHPLARDGVLNTLEDLWIPESIKGADAIICNGGLAIGIFGVGGWSKDRMVAPALESIPLRGRVVNVAFDSDIRDREKKGPLMMLAKFCHYLAWARGAIVEVAEIPYAEDGEKQGIDDVLAEVP